MFDALRPTPELSFAIRYLGCISGINITASHNKPQYNGYKVYWEDGAQTTIDGKFETELTVYASDRSGLLGDISRVFTDKNINITGVNTRTNRQGIATLIISFEIQGKNQLQEITEKLRQVPSVLDVGRNNG